MNIGRFLVVPLLAMSLLIGGCAHVAIGGIELSRLPVAGRTDDLGRMPGEHSPVRKVFDNTVITVASIGLIVLGVGGLILVAGLDGETLGD